ncbi:TPA: three component ABC system middle component [Klebsiella oxytoca]
MIQPWTSRPIEESYLFNPAFCVLLIAGASSEFTKKTGRPLPFALAFLILPIVLHKKTRQTLPSTTVTSFLTWIQDNKDMLINFSERVRRLNAVTRESLLFGSGHGALLLTEDGGIKKGGKILSPTEKCIPLLTEEARECIERAAFLGRWLAGAGTIATIYAAWGITP